MGTTAYISPGLQEEGRKLELERQGIDRNTATANTVLPVGLGQEFLNPEQYDSKFDSAFEVDKIDINATSLPADVLQNEINEGNIGSDFDLKQAEARYLTQRNSRERLSYESMLGQMAYELPYQLLNPINYPEFVIASMTGGMSTTARMATGLVAGGGTAYAGEAYVQNHTSYNDDTAKEYAALFGGALGAAGYGVFGRGTHTLSDKSVTQLQNSLIGSKIKVDGQVSIYARDEKGKFGLRKTDDDDIVPEATGFGRFAWGMNGVMRRSKSAIMRGHSEAFDVVGNSKGLNMKDTAAYIKELNQRNHMEAISQLTGLYNTSMRGRIKSKKMSVVDWNREAKHQFDRSRNGHPVAQEWKESVAIITKWADKQKDNMSGAGYKTIEDWTPRAYNENALRAAWDKDADGLVSVFKASALAKLTSKNSDAVANKLLKDNDKLAKLKQERIIEQDRIVADLIAKAKRKGYKGKPINKLLDKNGVPFKTAHASLRSIDGKIKRLNATGKAGKLSKTEAELDAKAQESAETFINGFINQEREIMDVDMLKERTYDFDETMIKDFLHQDITKIMMHTSNSTAGRMASKQRFGIGSKKDLEDAITTLRKELRAEGVLTAKEQKKMVKYFEKGIKSTWGTLMRATDPDSGMQLLKRFMMNTNFATMGGGFAATALQGEAAVLLMSGSFKQALKGMGIGFREFRNTIKGMPPNSAYAHQLQIMTYAYDVNTHSTLGRFVDGEHDPTSAVKNSFGGKVVEFSETAAEKVGKYGLLTSTTASIRMALGHVVIYDLFKTPMKKLLKDKDKYARLQIDLGMVQQMRDIDAKKGIFQYNKDGSIKSIDLEKLPRDLQHMVERGVSNASRLNVLTGDKMHLPSIYSDADNPVMQMILQFTSFPAQAWDSLLLRGMSENKIKLMVSVATGIVISSTLAMSNEEMKIKLGFMREDERRFDITTEEGMKNLGYNALKKGSVLAPISMAGDYLSQLTTGKKLGSDFYARGVDSLLGSSYQRFKDMAVSLQGIDFNPFDEHSNAWKTVYGRTLLLNSFFPGYTLPILGDAFRSWNKDLAHGQPFKQL